MCCVSALLYIYICICLCMDGTPSIHSEMFHCVCVFTMNLHVINVDRPVCLPSGLFLHHHPPFHWACGSSAQLYCPFHCFNSTFLLFTLLSFVRCLFFSSAPFLFPVLLVQFISLTHLLPIPLPSTSFPQSHSSPSHALSISCGLSGLRSCVMGDRRARLRSVTLICCG